MANHCIDVTCSNCGRTWCARGCNDEGGPDPARAERVKKQVREGRALQSGDACCGKQEVYMGAFYA